MSFDDSDTTAVATPVIIVVMLYVEGKREDTEKERNETKSSRSHGIH